MHKNATMCNKTQSKWCKNKHGASKIIDTFETYQPPTQPSGFVPGCGWCGAALPLLNAGGIQGPDCVSAIFF
jgi:hypothetical protein